MSIGENIQIYRKNLGMSQEELGQKLHVSRQTISLWEKEQTLPTIDNLIRLKEIFGVSVDEMLGFKNTEENEEVQPEEVYRLSFEKEEIKELNSVQIKPLYKKYVIVVLIDIVLLIVALAQSRDVAVIWLLLLVINIVSGIASIRKSKKIINKTFNRVGKSIYEYKFYEDYIMIDIYRNDERVRQSKLYYTDIEKVKHSGKWLELHASGQLYYLRKKDLKENSLIFSFVYKLIAKSAKKQKLPVKYNIASIALLVASLASFVAALVTIAIFSDNDVPMIENMWMFFLFLPVPVSSMIFGLVLNKKGYKCVKNIVVGIIMIVFLCIYGSFSFTLGGMYDHSDTPVVKIEQMLEMDIPECRKINTMDWTRGSQSVSRGYIYYTSDVYFDDNIASGFEEQLAADERWLPVLPNNLMGISSPFVDNRNYDYILVYNTNTYQFNELPSRGGTYHFANVMYNSEDNRMEIIEYDIEYME